MVSTAVHQRPGRAGREGRCSGKPAEQRWKGERVLGARAGIEHMTPFPTYHKGEAHSQRETLRNNCCSTEHLQTRRDSDLVIHNKTVFKIRTWPFETTPKRGITTVVERCRSVDSSISSQPIERLMCKTTKPFESFSL